MDYHSKKDPQKKAQKVADAFVDASSWKTDPHGSYTGKNVNYGEKPVQDVDDQMCIRDSRIDRGWYDRPVYDF